MSAIIHCIRCWREFAVEGYSSVKCDRCGQQYEWEEQFYPRLTDSQLEAVRNALTLLSEKNVRRALKDGKWSDPETWAEQITTFLDSHGRSAEVKFVKSKDFDEVWLSTDSEAIHLDRDKAKQLIDILSRWCDG